MPTISLEYFDTNNEKKLLEFSESLLNTPYKKESLFLMRVEGKSMQPLISDGTLVVVDLSQKELIHDAIYIVYYENRSWIKRAKVTPNGEFFISINQNFSHLIYESSTVRLIGRVLLTFSAL